MAALGLTAGSQAGWPPSSVCVGGFSWPPPGQHSGNPESGEVAWLRLTQLPNLGVGQGASLDSVKPNSAAVTEHTTWAWRPAGVAG